MVAASSSVKPLLHQYNVDSFLLSLIIVSIFLFGFGGNANKLVAVVGGGDFGSK